MRRPLNIYRDYNRKNNEKKSVKILVSNQQQHDSSKMRLKPSQILEEAKKDVKFGSNHAQD